jgi:Phytanoyl-CoA dioxygenase (PhyH)
LNSYWVARPRWVPVAELRIIPPWDGFGRSLFIYPHQDGFYNEGYRFMTAWMPLWRVSRATGGLALAQGRHRAGYLHDTGQPPRFPIPEGAIPGSAWRSADYEVGDVVIFDPYLPHSGLRNRSSNYFRVAYDVRFVLPEDPAPIVGAVVSATAESIVVQTEGGEARCFRLVEESYCRGIGRNAGQRLPLRDVPVVYLPGQEVMITLETDPAANTESVRLLREPKY